MTHVAIVNSGVANLASIRTAFESLGLNATVTSNPEVVSAASHLVLPGVGSFGSGMNVLRKGGLDKVVQKAYESDKPLLAICLGMQMLASCSDESPGICGLGFFPGRFELLPGSVRVPHLGWNSVEVSEHDEFLVGGYAAFANSFCLTRAPDGWKAAWTTHGYRFVSALVRGRTLACQFHPELSGRWGLELMQRWVSGPSLVEKGAGELGEAEGLSRRIIPCLDVKNGRVVKGVKFKQIRDAGDPATQAALYEAQGADEIVLLDIAATPEAKETQTATVRAVRAALHIPLTVGGGVRRVEDAKRLLTVGADKVSVNSAAVFDPSLLSAMAREFGTQCVVLAIDARRNGSGWEVLVSGGRQSAGKSAVEWAREGAAHGAGEILLTSWDRDGTRDGCDLELLESVTNAVSVPVIVSGGIGTRDHVAKALDAGADAVLAASVFHDGDETVTSIKQDLKKRGLVVRL